MAKNLDAFRNPAEATTEAEFEILWTDLMEEPDRPRAHLTLQERSIAGPSPAATPPPPAEHDRPGPPPPPAQHQQREHAGKKPARFRVASPRVGTTLERSTAANARRLQGLLAVPPRPPRRRTTIRPAKLGKEEMLSQLFGDLSDLSDDEAPAPANAPSTSPPAVVCAGPARDTVTTTNPPVVFGPVGPPPVRVAVGGLEIDVPYFSATVTRKFRACVGQRKFVLRFDRSGECVFRREI